MKGKTLIFAILFLLLPTLSSFATWDKRPEFRWEQKYRYDMRGNNHSLYINRISAGFTYFGKKENALLKLEPFFEARRNLDYDIWERYEVGLEIGKDIFSWLYLGQGFQEVWLKEDYLNYGRHKNRESTESETRLFLSHNFILNKHIQLKGFFLSEYTYDLGRGRATRNEMAIGFIIPLNKFLQTALNWRHIDRIHDFDSDNIDVAATLVF